MKYKQINIQFFYLVVLAALVVFEYFGLARLLYQGLTFVFQPTQIAIRNLSVNLEWPIHTLVRSINSAKKVQMLEERYSETLAQLTDLKKLEEENSQLRTILQNSDRDDREVIIAAPVVSQVGPTIGAGSDDGVEVGDLVFVDKTLVGRVREVFLNYAEIDLASQIDFQPLVVQTSEGYRGLIKGDGKRVTLTEMLSTEVPSDQARIETVGQVGVEKGLFVGLVGRLLSSTSETVATYQVIQYVDFYQARIVEIYK